MPDLTDELKAAYRDRAREMYGSDEIEVDDDAAFSEADEHVWVQGWLYVPREEVETPA